MPSLLTYVFSLFPPPPPLQQMLEDAQYKYALAESKRENFGQIGELEERVSGGC